MSAAQLEMFSVIRVHCFVCPHSLDGTTPTEAHDQMEGHYRERHAMQINRLVSDVAPKP